MRRAYCGASGGERTKCVAAEALGTASPCVSLFRSINFYLKLTPCEIEIVRSRALPVNDLTRVMSKHRDPARGWRRRVARSEIGDADR